LFESPYYTVLIGLLTFFLGLLVGHRLSLGRDRRKEFNDVAKRLRIAWSETYTNDADDLVVFENTMGYWQRRHFRKAWATYQAERKRFKVDKFARLTHDNPEALERARQDLIPFTKLR
jgi:hypothetical protein